MPPTIQAGQRDSICLSTIPQTFTCPQCAVLGGLGHHSSSITAALATTGNCFMSPPQAFSGLHIVYGGRRRKYTETPPYIEEHQFMLKLAKADGLLHQVGVLQIGVIKMESIWRTSTEQSFLRSNSMLTQQKLALLFNDPGKVTVWGCWDSSDFEDKTIILIEDLDVTDGLKGKIEHWLLPRVFFLEKAEGVDIILVQIPESELEKIHLFCEAGFRRVGHSDFFGRARSKSHPSRVLPMEKDGVYKSQPVPIPGHRSHQRSSKTPSSFLSSKPGGALPSIPSSACSMYHR
ncbi:hypothetical protein DFH06DRAFT_1290636 [Mycena polygramma]|nr:hypothetical protein DFH06DRAFT_1290636 [Mycena polygramma]